jgi:hypothetical protein
LSSDKKISIIATLHFNVIVRQVMALSLNRIIWYDFIRFLHVEIFVEEPFFSAKKLLDERGKEVHPRSLGLLLCPAVSGGHDILLCDQFRTKLTYTPPLLHASVELGCKKT